MGTQELQIIEFEVTELVPAKVISNIDYAEIVEENDDNGDPF